MSADSSAIASVEHGGFTVTSNTATAEEMTGALEARKTEKTGGDVQETHTDANGEPDLSHAASELGKKGAAAAAEKRAADAKEAVKAEKAAREAKEEPEAAEDKRKGNPRHDPQARVAQATREAKEAKEEAARLRAELERRERAREIEAPPTPPKQAKPEGAPKADDFETYEEFLDARDEYREKQREEKYAQREQEHNRAQRLDGYVQRYQESVKEAAKADPEFWNKISEDVHKLLPTFRGGPPNGGTWIADEIVDNAEQAPALLLHLSEHLEDFQRIAALQTPRQVTRAMASLVTRLDVEATATNSKQSVSKAQPPVRPVTGAPQVADEGTYREGMSLDDYAKRWKPAKSR